jgi:hypothetical protein
VLSCAVYQVCIKYAPALNDLRLEEANHGFREGVIVGVTPPAHGGRNAGIREAVRVPHQQIRVPRSLCWTRPAHVSPRRS